MTSPCEKYFIYIKIKQRAGGGSKRVCFSYTFHIIERTVFAVG